ncbi:MAG: hypothetical protein IKF38_05855 [Clostridia bacterium]|nr:hypothetical protein [Clostridia bacterium]
MKEKKSNYIKIIIFIFVIIVLIIIAMLFIIKNMKTKETNNKQVIDTTIKPMTQLIETKSVSEFYNINNCVNKYLEYIKNENKDAIDKLLISDYKNSQNINKENILNYTPKINYNFEFSPKKIYFAEVQIGVRTYLVNGKIYNKDTNENTDISLIVNIDYGNKSFEIGEFGKTYSKYINGTTVQEEIKNEIKSIEKNTYNQFEIINSLDEKSIMKYYFEQFILSVKYNVQEAYSVLDSKYRENRFENISNFENYVKENINDFEKNILVKYQIKEYDAYKEYLCKDNYGNFYIFKEKEPMNYTVMLDQYTVEDKIFTDNYKAQDKKGKAKMNLNKFEQMLNRKDYTSAYNVLNKEFKEKYFNSEDKFIEYVTKNFYRYNDFSYSEIVLENEKYKVTTTVANSQNSFRENTAKRFKVELLDNGSFSISFDI